MKTPHEPVTLSHNPSTYSSEISRAFTWYNQEKDKKDARAYLRSYLTKDKHKQFDQVPDSKILSTYGWMARMITNGCKFKDNDVGKLNEYLTTILNFKYKELTTVQVEKPVEPRPTVRDYLEDKIKDYLGELEGVVDNILYKDETFDLFRDLKSRNIPSQYCTSIDAWIKRKAGEFIGVYETKEKDVKEAYDHFGRRKITNLIKILSQWLQDVEKYYQFKKANRKPRVRKAKPAGVQVAKLKYKKEDTVLKIKSVSPVEVIGASQVWIYNTKYKRLAVYRTDSRDGLQVKGTTIQNYDPEQCEQKGVRKPGETLKRVLDGGKLVLRKVITELDTASYPITGRINEDRLIVRVLK